jgi:hypothetical protein
VLLPFGVWLNKGASFHSSSFFFSSSSSWQFKTVKTQLPPRRSLHQITLHPSFSTIPCKYLYSLANLMLPFPMVSSPAVPNPPTAELLPTFSTPSKHRARTNTLQLFSSHNLTNDFLDTKGVRPARAGGSRSTCHRPSREAQRQDLASPRRLILSRNIPFLIESAGSAPQVSPTRKGWETSEPNPSTVGAPHSPRFQRRPVTRHMPLLANSFRMRTSIKHTRIPFKMNTYKSLDLKSFRMNTYTKNGEGVPSSQPLSAYSAPSSTLRRRGYRIHPRTRSVSLFNFSTFDLQPLPATTHCLSHGICKILCSFIFPPLASFCSSFNPPMPQLARNGKKHSSLDCSALCG